MAVLPPDPVFSLRCPEMGPVNSICFHQSQRLLAGTLKGNVFLWDLQTNRSSLHFEVGSEPITSIHHTEDMLITQEKGGNIKLFSMTNSGYVLKRNIESNYVGYCKSYLFENTNGSEQLLFYPCDTNTVGVLHVNDSSAPVQMLVPDDPQLPKLGTLNCFKPLECASQMFLLAGYESGHFLTWDLSSGVIVDLLQLDPEPFAVDYDTVTNRGVIGGPTEKITSISYDRKPMQLLKSNEISIKNAGINCIRIRDDQKVFTAGCWDGRIRIFSWKSMRPLAVLTEHKQGGIMDIAYSKDKVTMWNARIMAAAGMDGQISLWDLYN